MWMSENIFWESIFFPFYGVQELKSGCQSWSQLIWYPELSVTPWLFNLNITPSTEHMLKATLLQKSWGFVGLITQILWKVLILFSGLLWSWVSCPGRWRANSSISGMNLRETYSQRVWSLVSTWNTKRKYRFNRFLECKVTETINEGLLNHIVEWHLAITTKDSNFLHLRSQTDLS